MTDGSWDANLCNQKLVGAQFYIEAFDQFNALPLAPNDFRSPRDSDGHGTHTSTTAAGNNNITPTGAAAPFGNVSGIAPRARVSTYKVCWDDGNPNTGGCFTADSAAALDQAVADGVDVINFSISGTTTAFLNVVEVAAFNAAAAGVFVAMSAGNTGPGASTVAHPSPWLTTVAASTHDRPAVGRVTLGNDAMFDGVSQIVTTVGPAPVIRAQDAGLPGADPNLLRQCFSEFEPLGSGDPVLDPVKVAGKIVVCERGGAGSEQRTRRQEPGGRHRRRDRDDPDQQRRQHAERRPALRPDRAPAEHEPRGDPDVRPDGRSHRDAEPGPGCHGRRAADRVVLVARAERGDVRPAEAGRLGSRCRRSRRLLACEPRAAGLPVQHGERHLDVEPARGRPRCAAHAQAPDVDAGDDQVVADDDGERSARDIRRDRHRVG